MTPYRPRLRHPRFFGHFWPSLWPCSCLNCDPGLSPSSSTENPIRSEIIILGGVFLLWFKLKSYETNKKKKKERCTKYLRFVSVVTPSKSASSKVTHFAHLFCLAALTIRISYEFKYASQELWVVRPNMQKGKFGSEKKGGQAIAGRQPDKSFFFFFKVRQNLKKEKMPPHCHSPVHDSDSRWASR